VEVEGIHSERPKNKPFFAVKNFSSERRFLVTLFRCCKRVTGSKGLETKTIMRTPRGMMARSVLLIFYKKLKHALALTALPRGVRMAFLTPNPFLCDLQ
tara:strand:+ start:68930 stop:69226 length:297 start_codon:yes stop_codon:yes gene_type:complete